MAPTWAGPGLFFSNWLISKPNRTTWFEIWIGYKVEVFGPGWNFTFVKLDDLNWTKLSGIGGHYFHTFWFLFDVPHTTWVSLRHCFIVYHLFKRGILNTSNCDSEPNRRFLCSCLERRTKCFPTMY